MPKSRDQYTAANREAWNEAASRHAAHNNARLHEAFKNPGHVSFQGDILETLLRLGVAGAAQQVELIRADIYQLPAELERSFDMVLSTTGVSGWLPEVEANFRVAQGLLKPGGLLVMEEMPRYC